MTIRIGFREATLVIIGVLVVACSLMGMKLGQRVEGANGNQLGTDAVFVLPQVSFSTDVNGRTVTNWHALFFGVDGLVGESDIPVVITSATDMVDFQTQLTAGILAVAPSLDSNVQANAIFMPDYQKGVAGPIPTPTPLPLPTLALK